MQQGGMYPEAIATYFYRLTSVKQQRIKAAEAAEAAAPSGTTIGVCSCAPRREGLRERFCVGGLACKSAGGSFAEGNNC